MKIMLQRLDSLVKDIDFRLTEIESRLVQTVGSPQLNDAKNGNLTGPKEIGIYPETGEMITLKKLQLRILSNDRI